MAAEIHVLFHGKLPNKAALTRTMKELGFPISIADPRESLEKQSGYMPMKLRRDESGVEFTIFEGRAAVEELGGSSVDPRFDRCASFRWGGDEHEMLCGLCSAAGLAKLVGGVVFEEQEGKLLSVDDAIAAARKELKSLKVEDSRFGTRPAHIRRFLKPLQALRSDLVLIDRMLIIRPVRHLLRGVFFDRTSDRYQLHQWRFCRALFGLHMGPGRVSGIIPDDRYFDVWEPDFEPNLMDALEDDFDRAGRMTTLSEFAVSPRASDRHWDDCVTSLVLSGERERADRLIEETLHGPQKPGGMWLSERVLKLLSGNINEICAACHAREAEVAKLLKIEHIWEPSPFPVELPTADRTSRSADPAFSTTPWIARPDWLLGEYPKQPGEVKFAEGEAYRRGRQMLLVPLTRDEAEARHRGLEDYMLVARRPNGDLFTIRRSAGWSPHRPPTNVVYSPTPRLASVDLTMWLEGSTFRARISTTRHGHEVGTMSIFSTQIYRRDEHDSIWLCYTNTRNDERQIHDHRGGPAHEDKILTHMPLTAEERDLATFTLPEFGEYADLEQRIRTLIRITGFGEFS